MSPWFEIPGGLVLEEPPEVVYTKSGSETRRVLTRVSKADHALLRSVTDKKQNPTQEDLVELAAVVDRMMARPSVPVSNDDQATEFTGDEVESSDDVR